MLIKTKRLTIRPVVKKDWRRIREIREDFQSSPYAQYDRPWSMEDEDVRRRIAVWAEAGTGRDHRFFAVCLRDEMIGYIAFNRRPDGYEIGYCFHSAFGGRGYAKESCLALFDYAKSLEIRKLKAGTAISNLPSAGLLRSLGFQQTGTEKVSFYKDSCGNDIVFDGGIFELDL